MRLFLFISEPEESDHDYQPVGGTGKLLNVNVYLLKFTNFTERRLLNESLKNLEKYAVIFSLSRELVVCDIGMSGVVYCTITYSEDKYLIYWHFNECLSLVICLWIIFASAIFDPWDPSGYAVFFLSTGQSGHILTCGLEGLRKTAINFSQNGRAPNQVF